MSNTRVPSTRPTRVRPAASKVMSLKGVSGVALGAVCAAGVTVDTTAAMSAAAQVRLQPATSDDEGRAMRPPERAGNGRPAV